MNYLNVWYVWRRDANVPICVAKLITRVHLSVQWPHRLILRSDVLIIGRLL